MKNRIFGGEDQFGQVEVYEEENCRYLCFGNAVVQSVMSLAHPYQLNFSFMNLMLLGLLFQPHPQRILLLGLGGGCLARLLWKSFPTSEIDCIERSPLTAEVCKNYFYLPEDERLKIHLADARDYLSKSRKKYTYIIIDIATKEGIPLLLTNESFFALCKKKLETQGVLCWNFWLTADEDALKASIEAMTAVFDRQIMLLPAKDYANCIALAFPYKVTKNLVKKAALNSQLLSEKTGVDFNALLGMYDNLETAMG